MSKVIYSACPLCGSSDIAHALATSDYSVSKEPFELFDCRGCGLRFTQGVPEASDAGRYYQSEDYISHSDTREGLINQLYHLARQWMLGSKRRMVQQHTPHKRLLDIGSGTGYFLSHMQAAGYQVMGVEVDDKARIFSQSQFGLDVRTPKELEEGLLPGTFGAITLWHVLEHVYDPGLYLQRIYDMLEPDGILVVAVPNYTSFDGGHYGPFWAAYDVPRHLWHFSPATMERFLAANHFRMVGKRRLPLDPFYVALLSEKYRQTGIAGFVHAAWNGLVSTLYSWLDIGRSSSVVYFFRKGQGPA